MFRKKKRLEDLPRKNVTLDDLREFPEMTSWFSPSLLFKLLWRVIVSDLFGQYADRRLIEAALDPASLQEIQTRDDLTKKLPQDNHGAVWIDFVADLGDGFDATYAVAYLLAQPQLDVDGETLPRGGALFMGGDEVYPTSGRYDYIAKMRLPYEFALPSQPKSSQHPPIFAIPGNHDWYDGLVNFLAFFAREKSTSIGNWRTQQKRSYFAAKINENCWLWAIDIALVADMDQPQANYFVAAAKDMPQGANIILCSAEPGWYKVDSDSYRTLSYAANIAEGAGKALRIPLVLSGDTHHYARYTSTHGTEYITSGGGGAFLHGTHQLPSEIEAEWLRYSNEKLVLQFCYPDQKASRRLLKGDFCFPFLNYGFALALGSIYAIAGYILSLVPRLDVAVVVFLILITGFVEYSSYQERNRNWLTVVLASVHAVVQFCLLLFLTFLSVQFDSVLGSLRDQGPWWLWLLQFAIPMIFGGGVVAGFVFGANLYFTCRYAGMNSNDAFSAMRLDAYRNFLRLRIVGDQITVYPIGIDKVPTRNEWRDNEDAEHDPAISRFLPPESFAIRLIEKPIIISGSQSAQTMDVRKPIDLPPKG